MTNYKCCVCGSSDRDYKMHRFPRDVHLSNIWAKNIGIECIIATPPKCRYNKYRICRKHFEIHMYPHKILSHRLKKSAVPTLFTLEEPYKNRRKTRQEEKLDLDEIPLDDENFSENEGSEGNAQMELETQAPLHISLW